MKHFPRYLRNYGIVSVYLTLDESGYIVTRRYCILPRTICNTASKSQHRLSLRVSSSKKIVLISLFSRRLGQFSIIGEDCCYSRCGSCEAWRFPTSCYKIMLTARTRCSECQYQRNKKSTLWLLSSYQWNWDSWSSVAE